ncbi:MAG: phosphatidate cytidylyltransferase [Rikenellaceae bacterium]
MKMRESRNNIVVRGFYGLVFAMMVIGAILLGHIGFGLLLLTIVVGGTIEFYRMTKLRGYKPQYILGLLSSITLFAINYDYIFYGGNSLEILEMIFILTIPAMFISELFSASKTPIADLGSTLLSLIYVAIPTMLLCNVAMLLGGGEWNSYIMLAYIFIIWANDSFAYLVGITIGSHVMFPRISPKKSWEGFVGGVLGAFVVGVVAALLLDQNYYIWGAMAIIASVTGVLGDLVESMFKRSVEIKDSGNIIPGHGGWLDRFDALLISTPIVYAFLSVLNIVGLI